MKTAEALSVLDNLIHESKIARATIEFSSVTDRLQKRVLELEQENEKIKVLLKEIYKQLNKQ